MTGMADSRFGWIDRFASPVQRERPRDGRVSTGLLDRVEAGTAEHPGQQALDVVRDFLEPAHDEGNQERGNVVRFSEIGHVQFAPGLKDPKDFLQRPLFVFRIQRRQPIETQGGDIAFFAGHSQIGVRTPGYPIRLERYAG